MSNQIVIDGTVFRPVFRTTVNGKDVFRFYLSFYDGKNQNGEACYGSIRVTAWNALATNAHAVIHERNHVIVSGQLRHNTWVKNGVKHFAIEIIADNIGSTINRFSIPEAEIPF